MKQPTFLHSRRLCSTDESLLFLNRVILWSVYRPGLICLSVYFGPGPILHHPCLLQAVSATLKRSAPLPVASVLSYPFLLHESWLWCISSEAAVAWIIILKLLFSSQNFAETWWVRKVLRTETTVQGYKPNRRLIRKIGILVFKKNTLL